MQKDWLDEVLAHSFKGTTWSDHKYIGIRNGRYIYPEDLKKQRQRYGGSQNQFTSQNRQNGRSYKGNTGLFSPNVPRHARSIKASKEWVRERSVSGIQANYNKAVAANDHEAMSKYSQQLNNMRQSPDWGKIGNAVVNTVVPERVRSALNVVGNYAQSAVPKAAENIRNDVTDYVQGIRDMATGKVDPFEETVNTSTPPPPGHEIHVSEEDWKLLDEMSRKSLEDWRRHQEDSERAAEERKAGYEALNNFGNSVVSSVQQLANLRTQYSQDPIGTLNMVASRLQYAYDIGNPVAIAEAEEEYNYINSLAR